MDLNIRKMTNHPPSPGELYKAWVSNVAVWSTEMRPKT